MVMPPFHKILVAVDFSGFAAEAVRVAAGLSKLCDAPLTLVHVYQLPIYPLPPEGMIFPPPEVLAEQQAGIDRELARAAAEATAAGAVAVTTTVRQGPPAEEIVELARADGYDLICMGTHGRTGIKHILLGSVAEQVVRRAPCAVLTIRPSASGG
ncbi:MAG TPA: universal stress protein [Kofleriaceae bacterium]|nr:universal stress protein [Kofleriaceae bacterium]